MFQWEDFREIANELLKNGDEAHIRCAISRNYYSIFGSTREYLINVMHKQEFEYGKDIHWRIYDELINSSDLNEVYLAKCLGFLRIARNHADYDNFDGCSIYFKKNVEKILNKTNDAFDLLNVLQNNPPFDV